MFKRSIKKDEADVKHRRRFWSGVRRKHDDKGDPLAGALVAIAIIAAIAIVGVGYFAFLDSGKAAVTQAQMSNIRAHITQVIGQRPTIPANGAELDPVAYTTDYVTEATDIVTSLLNTVNNDPGTEYKALISGTATAATGANAGITGLTVQDVSDFTEGELWVFVAPGKTILCDSPPSTITGTNSNAYGEDPLGVTAANANAGDLIKSSGEDIDNECASAGEGAFVRRGRNIIVGGVTDQGSQYCVKYTQANADLDANGFTYWHTKSAPDGTADFPGTYEDLNNIQADCGALYMIARLIGDNDGANAQLIPPQWANSQICGATSPRGAPEAVKCQVN